MRLFQVLTMMMVAGASTALRSPANRASRRLAFTEWEADYEKKSALQKAQMRKSNVRQQISQWNYNGGTSPARARYRQQKKSHHHPVGAAAATAAAATAAAAAMTMTMATTAAASLRL